MLRHLLLIAILWTSQALATNILLPLYQSPEKGAWQPLYTALKAHPSVVLEIIINPNSGPSSATPDPQLAAAIKKLRSFPNAAIIGYLPTGYGKRNGSVVQSDIDLYAAWPAAVAPTGIFFDEVDGSEATALKSSAAYARRTLKTTSIKAAARVVFNPGTVPDTSSNAALFEAADRVVIYESAYKELASQAAAIAAEIKATGAKRNGLIIHTTPMSALKKVVSQYLAIGVGSLYVTDDPATYQKFGEDWVDFTALIDVDHPKS